MEPIVNEVLAWVKYMIRGPTPDPILINLALDKFNEDDIFNAKVLLCETRNVEDITRPRKNQRERNMNEIITIMRGISVDSMPKFVVDADSLGKLPVIDIGNVDYTSIVIDMTTMKAAIQKLTNEVALLKQNECHGLHTQVTECATLQEKNNGYQKTNDNNDSSWRKTCDDQRYLHSTSDDGEFPALLPSEGPRDKDTPLLSVPPPGNLPRNISRQPRMVGGRLQGQGAINRNVVESARKSEGNERNSVILGTAQSGTLKVCKDVKFRKSRLFVSRLDKETDTNDIKSHVVNTTKINSEFVNIVELNTKYDTYKSFCVELPCPHWDERMEKLSQADSWMEGILVKPWFGRPPRSRDEENI